MPERTTTRKRRSRLLLVLVIVGVSLLAGEAFLRLADPFAYRAAAERDRFMRVILAKGNRRQPDVSTTYLGKPVHTNSRGLRNPETPYEPPPGAHRLLVLGDSVPFGWGVGDGDDFPRVLQRRLNQERHCAPERCEVINGAYPGWDLPLYGKFLMEEGLRYQPETVLLMLINNDVPRADGVNARARFHLPVKHFLSNRLRKALVLRVLDDCAVYLLHEPPPADYDPIRAPDEAGVDLAVAVLGEILRMCRQAGAELVLLDTLEVERIIGFCRDEGVRRIAVAPSPEQMERWAISKVDLHPNEEAHAWMAERILEGLVPP